MILFTYLNLGILLLLMTSRTAFSQTTDCYEFEEELFKNLREIKLEMKTLQKTMSDMQLSINTLLYNRVSMENSQKELDTKLENVMTEVKNVNEVSSLIRNNSFNSAFNTDILITNQIKTDSKFEELFSEIKKIKEISEVLRNNSHLTAQNIGERSKIHQESGLDKTEEEKTCNGFPQSFLLIINTLFNMNTSQYEDVTKNFNECWKDLPKSMEGHSYFLTPKLRQVEAVKYCKEEGAKPFIPQNQEEFIYYIAMTVEPESDSYSWYPINDIETEGHLVLEDGTDYENSSYKLPFWEELWSNSKDADCATVDIGGKISFTRCYHYDFQLLCQGNLS